MKYIQLILIPLLLILAHSGNGYAQTEDEGIQALEDIEQAVVEFLKNQHSDTADIEIDVKSLDSRLRLQQCEQALEATWSPGSRSVGRVTVQVVCPYPKPWRVHVQSSVTLQGMVWALVQGVGRGAILGPEMLVRKTVSIGANSAALNISGMPIIDIEPWLGYAFAQRVNTGAVLNERMLEPAMLVEKGETVLIVHVSAGLSLQTKGVALNAAAKGARIQVRNSSSGKTVEGTVVARGVVQIL